MCAISGVIAMDLSEEAAIRMLRSMRRRGPDGEGVVRSGEAVLLHTRLAIIDPDGGAQPMRLHWQEEDYTLVYNGELYNTEELREELVKLGHRFLGHSDTEVVLHAYAEYGKDCVDRFNGIFAFGVWESCRRRLFLARDRIGVKPLFYALPGRGIVFASEIKTILASTLVKPMLGQGGAAQIVLLGPGRLPGSGVLEGVFELEPGCRGFFEAGAFTLERYWRLTDREHRQNLPDTVDTVRQLVRDAIRRQMVSDVPIGTFLSGGLDSSIITAVCAGELAQKGQCLQTFSVDYENNDRFFTASKFQPNSDTGFIRLMLEAIPTDHHWTVLTAENLADELENATIARDLPGMADVDFSLLAFCRRIRNHVKVALSGECADEIFGGYPWYRDPEVRERAGFPWAQNTRDRASMLAPAVKVDAEEFVMEAYNQTCRDSDILPGTPPLEKRMKQMVNLNFRWFMQTLLDRKDRMSMYCGLEVRVPFCDWRIAEYLYGVPWGYKDLEGREKGLLRKAVEGLLPQAVLERKKSPYPKTFDPRYERLMQERLTALLTQDAPLWQLVRKEQVKAVLEQQTPWPWYGQLMRRPQTMAYLLQINFWLDRYGIKMLF